MYSSFSQRGRLWGMGLIGQRKQRLVSAARRPPTPSSPVWNWLRWCRHIPATDPWPSINRRGSRFHSQKVTQLVHETASDRLELTRQAVVTFPVVAYGGLCPLPSPLSRVHWYLVAENANIINTTDRHSNSHLRSQTHTKSAGCIQRAIEDPLPSFLSLPPPAKESIYLAIYL